MFVVDLLHEFELGVWKATFTHLLRILYAAGGDTLQELNKRSVLCSLVQYVLSQLVGLTDIAKFLLLAETRSVVFTRMRLQ
jgi:hypothetical protein